MFFRSKERIACYLVYWSKREKPIVLLVQKREKCVLYLFKRETSIDLLVYVPGQRERVVKEIKQLSIPKKKKHLQRREP